MFPDIIVLHKPAWGPVSLCKEANEPGFCDKISVLPSYSLAIPCIQATGFLEYAPCCSCLHFFLSNYLSDYGGFFNASLFLS